MEINVKAMIDRIECRITELGITKEEFYASSGISSASFSQWNTGVHKPTPKKIASAAKALGVPVSYLVEGVEQKENPATESSEVSEKDIRLLNWFRSLPVEKQRAILVSQDAPEDVL